MPGHCTRRETPHVPATPGLLRGCRRRSVYGVPGRCPGAAGLASSSIRRKGTADGVPAIIRTSSWCSVPHCSGGVTDPVQHLSRIPPYVFPF